MSRAVRFEYPVDSGDRGAIRRLARRCPQAKSYAELRVLGRLDEGRSGARVYDAEWVATGPGHNDRLILKADTPARLAREFRVMASFRDRAPNFMPVVAASFDLEAPPATGRECIAYAHVSSHYPGRPETLEARVRDAVRAELSGEKALDGVLEAVGRTLACLERQLRRGETQHRQWSPIDQRDFYLCRWWPTVEVECRTAKYGPDGGLELSLYERITEPLEPVVGDPGILSLVGEDRVIEGEKLAIFGRSIYVNVLGAYTVLLQGLTPEALPADGGSDPSSIFIRGRVKGSEHAHLVERWRALDLDPDGDTLLPGRLELPNPLRARADFLKRLEDRRPWPTRAFSHGDLHGGNVLCLDGVQAIIDHAEGGDGQPSWADAARLIGTLWRNAVAPQLERRALIEAATAIATAAPSAGAIAPGIASTGPIATGVATAGAIAPDVARDAAIATGVAATGAASASSSPNASPGAGVSEPGHRHHDPDSAGGSSGDITDGSPGGGTGGSSSSSALEGQAALARSFLEGAIARALREGYQGDEAEREMWIDLYYFSWIGLKWEGTSEQHLAMIVLASLAQRQIEALERRLARQSHVVQSVKQAVTGRGALVDMPRVVGALLDYAAALEGAAGIGLRLQLRERILKVVGEKLLEWSREMGPEEGLLPRLLEKAVTGTWGEQDSRDAAELRWDRATLYRSADRVLLVDTLFLACLRCWDPRAFDVLLDLAGDGEEDVEAEAALVIALLLNRDEVVDAVRQDRRVAGRLDGLLRFPERLQRLTLANHVWQSYRTWLATPAALWDLPNIEALSWSSWLRPLDLERDVPEESRRAAQEGLLDSLRCCPTLAEVVKVVIVRLLPGLSPMQREEFARELGEENRVVTAMRLEPLRLHYAGRLFSLSTFVHYVASRKQHEELELKAHSLRRGGMRSAGGLLVLRLMDARALAQAAFEALGNDEMTAIKLAREADNAYCAVFPFASFGADDYFWWGLLLGVLAEHEADPDQARGLREEACRKYEATLAVRLENHLAWYGWGLELSRLAGGATDPDQARGLSAEACRKYEAAVAVKPDMHEVLHNWALELSRLAETSVDADQKRRLREQACQKYEAAVAVKPDKYAALYNWGNELGRLAGLSRDADQKRRLREEACRKYEAAVTAKPDNHEALYNLSIELLNLFHMDAGSPDHDRHLAKAHAALERVAAIRGVPIEQLYSYACVLACEGRKEDALASLKACVSRPEVSRLRTYEGTLTGRNCGGE